MAVSIRVVIYPMKLRIRFVTIIMDIMATTTTSTMPRVITIITAATMFRVILVATMTPFVTTNAIHVALIFNPATSFTCTHSVTTWVTVVRVVVMHLSIWE
jgi:hypothetical protein